MSKVERNQQRMVKYPREILPPLDLKDQKEEAVTRRNPETVAVAIEDGWQKRLGPVVHPSRRIQPNC